MKWLLHKLYSLNMVFKYLFSGKKVAIYVGGYPSIPNVGDVALFKAYELLFSDYKFIHFSGGKLERFFFSLLQFKRPLPILAGGTLINHMCLREAIEGKGIFGPLYVFGTGVAQSSYWHGKDGYLIQEKEWTELLRDSPFLGVRGPLSTQQLDKFGLNGLVFGDPVLSLAQLRSHDKVMGNKGEKTIGLNVGKSLGFVQGGEENLEKVFIGLSRRLIENGYKIKWFVVCPEDHDINLKISREVGGEVIKIYHDYEDYYRHLEGVLAFIGTKLHSVCLGLNKSVPSIMVEYRPKCRDFMASLDLEEYSIAAEDCTVESLINRLEKILDNYEDTVNHINKNIQKYIDLQKRIVEQELSKRYP